MPAYRGPDGKIVYASDEDAGRFEAGGYERVGEAAAGMAQNRIAPVDNGITGSIGATVSAGLSGATLGASDWLLKGVLDKGQFEQLAQDRADNPGLSGAAQFAGAFLPAVVSGGTATPSGYLSHLAAEGIGSAEAVGGAAGAARSLAIAGGEGAVQNAGAYLSDVALGDRDLTAEGMVGALGTGFAFGSGGLIAGHGIVAGTTAARRMFARYAAGGEEAAQAAQAAWQEQGAKALESFDQAEAAAKAQLQEAQLARQQADLARKQAAAAVAEAKIAPPPEVAGGAGPAVQVPGQPSGDVELAGLMRDRAMAATDPQRMVAWDAQNGQRLQELMAARTPTGEVGIGEPSAPTNTAIARRTDDLNGLMSQLKAMSAPQEADLASKLSEYRAARDAFDSTHAAVDPDLDSVLQNIGGITPQREPVPVGEFGAPGARGYKPGEIPAPGPPSQAPLANAVEGTPVTRAMRKGAAGEPTKAFDFKDSGLAFDPETRQYTTAEAGAASKGPARELASEKEFRDFQSALQLRLTDNEIEQSLRYSREYYMDVNRHLRGDARNAVLPESEAKIIPALDSMLDKSRTAEPIITHRGASMKRVGKLQPGDVYVDPAYGSTSWRSNSVGTFGDVHMIIESPAGTRIAPIPSSKSEGEFLLPRDTKYRITGRRELPDGRVELHATAEDTPPPAGHEPLQLGPPTIDKPLDAMSKRELEYSLDKAADHQRSFQSPTERRSPEFEAAKNRYNEISERLRAVKAGAEPVEWHPPAPVPSAAPADDLLSQLQGTAAKLGEGASITDIGAASREAYASNKAARTAEAADHFRAKALEAQNASAPWNEGIPRGNGGTYETSAMAAAERDMANARETPGRSVAMKRLEMAHDDALERATAATEPVEKAAAQAEARVIEQQMTAVGKKPGAVEDVAAMAPVVHRLEKAAADLTEALGDAAPAAAKEHAAAFRQAEDVATEKSAARTARAADDHATAREQAQADDLVNGPSAKERAVAAAKRQRAEAEAAYQKARVAEAEASIGAKRAASAASEARASMPPPPAGAAPAARGTGNRLVSGAHAIGYAAELGSDLGIPGIPRPHDIPVIGPLLSAYLKYRAFRAAAGRFVGRIPATAETRAAELAARTRDGIARSMDRSLGLIERNPTAVRAALTLGAVQANKALSKRLIDDGKPDATEGASVSALAAVRMREVAAAVANPSLISDMVRKQTRDVMDPELIQALENHLQSMFAHLNDTAPKGPPPNPLTKQEWKPPVAAATQWAQRVAVANNPQVAFDLLEAGKLTPAAADTLRVCYQKLFAEAQQRLAQRAADLEHPVPYRQLMQAGLLFDTATHASLDPENATVMQQAHVAPPQPTPQSTAPPVPGIAAPTNLNSLYQTSADRRAAR